MIRASVFPFLAACIVLTTCGGATRFSVPSDLRPEGLTLAGEFNIPPLGRFPPVVGLPFGGLSGLAPLSDGRYLAVCDERDGARVYRLRISGEGRSFRVEPEDVIGLQVSGDAPSALDPEAIVATPDNTMIIASEGIGNSQPRIPPSLLEYGMDGQFIRSIPLPARFMPNTTGPLTAGARDNAALESLTMTSGGDRMFTAFETAVVQDGEPAGIGRGTVARILEYVRDEGTYSPRREFAYIVEPVAPAAFEPAITVTGLVELLAVSGDELLAMERTYMAERRGDAAGGRALNRIRVYRVWLDGATDVSHIDSLKGATYTPARKTLVLDLSEVKGLSPELATLDNFEGMAVGPALVDGARSLLLVSDDNFHETQRTSFLLFRGGATNQTLH